MRYAVFSVNPLVQVELKAQNSLKQIDDPGVAGQLSDVGSVGARVSACSIGQTDSVLPPDLVNYLAGMHP